MSGLNPKTGNGSHRLSWRERALLLLSHKIAFVLLCTALGVLTAFAYARSVDEPLYRQLLVGAVWGLFIGGLITLELSSIRSSTKATLQTLAGAGLGFSTAATLAWPGDQMLAAFVIGALLGFLAPYWIRYVNLP